MKKLIKELNDRVINEEGELLLTTNHTEHWVDPEPDYIKVYLKDIISLKDLPKGTSSVLFCFLKRMSYENDIVINNSLKKVIAKELDISERTVVKAIEELTQGNILIRKDKGFYYFNPNIFGRGKWQNIKKIRMTINYSEKGREVKTEFKYETEAKHETDAVSNS